MDVDAARRPRFKSSLQPVISGDDGLFLISEGGQAWLRDPVYPALARMLDGTHEVEAIFTSLAGRYPAEQPFAGWLREPDGREVRGTLLGGCLSLLVATLGTPFAPDLEAGIVFWEDVGEPPYRIDRMLTHLGLSGNLANIAGMIVGSLGEGQGPDGEPADWSATVADALAGFSWPLAWGLESGHVAPNRTLPVGLPARLERGRLLLGDG